MGKYILTGGLVGPWRKTKMSKISNVFEITATVSENDQGKTVITTDRTAEEWYNAAVSGATAHVSSINSALNAPVEIVLPFEIFRVTIDDVVVYTIKARADIESSDKLFMAEEPSGDLVVLTEV